MNRSALLVLILACTLMGCGGDDKPAATPNGGTNGAPAADPGSDADGHGAPKDLGTLELMGNTYAVTLLGTIEADKEGAFSVHSAGQSAADLAALSLFLWVESADGTQLSRPAKGTKDGEGLHYHCMPKADSEPVNVVLRLRADGKDERGRLPLSGHGHVHEETPHHGVMGVLGGEVGHLELKLHDDKGDLELWLTCDAAGTSPLDLPLDTVVRVTLIDKGKTVELHVRNREQNEDEDGNAQVRDGKTNYFIFPSGDEDASWLQGKEFSSLAVVEFLMDGKTIKSEEFSLVPHVH